MSLFNKLFCTKKKNATATSKTAKKPSTSMKADNNPNYNFTTPGLAGCINGRAETVVVNKPSKGYHKIIINENGYFENFPGITKGRWTSHLTGNYDFNSGRIDFRTDFEKLDNGYRCLWMIQPDGWYWADEGGFGAEDDSEIILYADLDENGNFLSPFRIYKIDGRRIEESSPLAKP